VRNFPNWLEAFVEYAGFGEAPKRMYFWTGVSTLAGVLQRRCWIDQESFIWYPNFYVVLVAPPGVVSKSTTAALGMNLLRQIPGIQFGPEVVTWQALAQSFTNAAEAFELNGTYYTQSPLTIESSEFGNLLDPQDKNMVDFLVTMWDGKSTKKETKNSGSDNVVNPWLNIIACTTPAWIAGNFPEYMIGGGLTSRMVFVYAEKKERYVAYPKLVAKKNFQETQAKLINDLMHIRDRMVGEFDLTKGAYEFGKKWYEHHYQNRPKHLDDNRFGGYIARKQTHMHKLAMVLAAAESDELLINEHQLALASTMVTDLEEEMALVFSKIGKANDSVYADRIVELVAKQGPMDYREVFRHVHSNFPSLRTFEDIFAGLVRAGMLLTKTGNGQVVVEATAEGRQRVFGR
jgi:hypothetical protein